MLRKRNRWTAVVAAALAGLLALGGCGAPPREEAVKPQEADPVTTRQLDKLNELADRFYHQVSEGDLIEARNSMQELEKALPDIRFTGVTSPEGVQAFHETVLQASRVFNAMKFSMEDGQVAAAKVRLATDALTHKEQPMWLQYYRILQEELNKLDGFVTSRESGKLSGALDPLYAHFSVIRPSAMISREPAEIVKVDSLFAFLKSQAIAPEIDYANMSRGVSELRSALNALFRKGDAAAYVPIAETRQPVYWALALGTVILLALAYTAWKMIEYERSAFSSGSSRRRR